MRLHDRPAPRRVQEVVQRLVSDADIEIIPLKGADDLSALPPKSAVTITCSPKLGLERTWEHSARAAASGHRVVPHLAARQVTGHAELEDRIGRLDELGITDLYVVGGDVDEPAGPYRNAGDLLDALATLEHRITSIGVACYPEGHPKIPDQALTDALLRNQHTANYMVSQLCFDPRALSTWLHKMRDAGVRLPLHVGLAAPLKTRKLIELSMRIGVGSSLRYLTKQHGVLGHLVVGNSYEPEKLLRGLGSDLLDPLMKIDSLHLFSFNQLAPTVQWQRRVGHRSSTARLA